MRIPLTESELMEMLKELPPEQLKEMLRTGKVPVRWVQNLPPQWPAEITELFREKAGEEWICHDG